MLRTLLAQIHAASDVGGLFQHLGYERVDQPIENDATVIARWKAFTVILAEASDPQARARGLAQWIGANSIRGMAVAMGQRRELVVAAPRIGQAGTTRGLTVSLTHPSRFALDQLARLRPRRDANALSHAIVVSEVLRTEIVGLHFFRAFRAALERMAATLGDDKSLGDRKLVALLVLTRVLFLYFVQAKGWLDGRPDYLRSLLDTALGKRHDFHGSSLDPLFFGTLNLPPRKRAKHGGLGRIPYLNGGLFEPHPAERRLGSVHFSNDLWRDTFDDLFERFRFCVHESGDDDAIAPDMLGRVFEGLMDTAERRDSGTFYTPEHLVGQVVQATLETALAAELSRHAAERVVRLTPKPGAETETATKILAAFTLLDPAVGSGAFLLGALEALCRIRTALNAAAGIHTPTTTLRRNVLRANLFGVDLNPVAVRLAELRLWLAVIADDATDDIRAIAPLPNLDGVVRQGDTLLDPIGAARRFDADLFAIREDAIAPVRRTRERLFDARGTSHRRAQQALRRAETNVARRLLNHALHKSGAAIRDMLLTARSHDLFGRRRGFTPTEEVQYRRWVRLRKDAKQALRQLDDARLPFFSFEVHAPDIVRQGGFSVVVGNPPWVRSEVLEPSLKALLKDRFGWWRSVPKQRFGHLPDLSVAFFERCLELTRPGGAVGLLLPSKVVSAGYGETARRHLVRETSIAYIHRVPDTQAAFGATTYPMSIVLRNKPPSAKHTIRLGFDRQKRITQAALDRQGPWILVPDVARNALAEFVGGGTPLGEVAPPMLGVKTGADRIFVGRLIRRTGATAIVWLDGEEVELEANRIRVAVRGRDVRPFRIRPSRVILWGHEETGKPLRRLPSRAAAYVRTRQERLRRRADYSSGPLWTVFRTRCTQGANPVSWPDLVKRPVAVAMNETLEENAVPLNTCYVAHAPDREGALALAGVINSTWAMAYCLAAGNEARGGYRRLNATLAAHLPVPQAGPKRTDLAALSARAHDQQASVTKTDIDEAVAASLGLSRRSQLALRSLAADHS